MSLDQDARFIVELNVLRYELLGHSSTMPGATQEACKRYQCILARMGDGSSLTERLLLRDIKARIDDICGGLDKGPARNPGERSERIQKSVTDLRMIVDMHLHVLSTGH